MKLGLEIKGCIRRFKKSKDFNNLIDIVRLIVYYTKKHLLKIGA